MADLNVKIVKAKFVVALLSIHFAVEKAGLGFLFLLYTCSVLVHKGLKG